VRRLAQRHDDTTIAQILSKHGRRTGTGLPFNRSRVCSLRHTHGIPVFDPQAAVTPSDDDGEVVTIYQAERILGVDHSTIYRWLHSGFIEGEQLAAGGPWRLRITDGLRRRIVPEVPDGWLPLDQAAKALGVARQTVLHKVQRGELEAVHVSRGKRKGLRIKVFGDSPGLFATTE
jgi:transposase